MPGGRYGARVWSALGVVYLVWGSAYLGIKWADESLPPLLQTRVNSDFRSERVYFDTALNLLLGLYGIGPRHPAVVEWKRRLGDDESRETAS